MNMRTSLGAQEIIVERLKQLDQWGPRHDDQHDDQELVKQARSLLEHVICEPKVVASNWVPMSRQDLWGLVAKHPNPRDQLIIAGALIAAEIDRLDRATKEKK